MLLPLSTIASSQKTIWNVTKFSHTRRNHYEHSPHVTACLIKCSKRNHTLCVAIEDVSNACFCNSNCFPPSAITFYNKDFIWLSEFYSNHSYYPLLAKALFFAPFSENTKFKSFGTEINQESMSGAEMQFTEPGPFSPTSTTKYMRLETSVSDYIQYSVPASFSTTIDSEGLIVTFWLKIRDTRFMPLLEFGNGSPFKANIWLYDTWRKLWTNRVFTPEETLKTGEIFQLNKWHHVGVVYKRSSVGSEIWIDGVREATTVSEEHVARILVQRSGNIFASIL